MQRLPSVLWIEDQAFAEFDALYAPLFVEGFKVDVVGDATQALLQLSSATYDVVIVDIRIPPGTDQRWIEFYRQFRADPDSAQLGLHLLRGVLGSEGPPSISFRESEIPTWLSPRQCGVFSVDVGTRIDRSLIELGIKMDQTLAKGPEVPRTALLALVKRLLAAA